MAASRHFLSFADSRLVPSLRRIAAEATATGLFNSVTTATERSLDEGFRGRCRELLKPMVRGYGYWIWKPQVILQRLGTLSDGELLAYCDAGCHFTQRGRDRLQQYFDCAAASAVGLVGFKYFPPQPPFPYDGRQLFAWRNGQWIKGDVLVHFDLMHDEMFLNDYCFAGGILFCRNSPESREFFRSWLEVMESDTHLIDDSPSRVSNRPEFIEHRHDQAVFNCLAYKHGVSALCGYELQYPGATPDVNDWETIREYPIHARREKQLSGRGRLWMRMHRAWARFQGKS